MKKLIYFNSPINNVEFTKNKDNSLSKRGFLLVEGHHVDNKGRHHVFDKAKLERIVANTNHNFSTGMRVPVFKDHVKTQDSVCGDLNDLLEARIVTEEDVNGKHKHLIGKLGIFTNDVLIKSQSAIEQVLNGLASTISPGIDLVNDCIKEISLTAQPSIQGLALFNEGDNSQALTWDELEQSNMEMDEFKEQLEELSEKFSTLVCNILHCCSQEMDDENQSDPEQLISQAMEEYMMRIKEVIGMQEEEEPMDANNLQVQEDGSYNYPKQNMMQRQSQYSLSVNLPEVAEFEGFRPTPDGKMIRTRPNFLNRFKNNLVRDYTSTAMKAGGGKTRVFNPLKANKGKLKRLGVVGAVGAGGLMAKNMLFPKQQPQQPKRFGLFNEEDKTTIFSPLKKKDINEFNANAPIPGQPLTNLYKNFRSRKWYTKAGIGLGVGAAVGTGLYAKGKKDQPKGARITIGLKGLTPLGALKAWQWQRRAQQGINQNINNTVNKPIA